MNDDLLKRLDLIAKQKADLQAEEKLIRQEVLAEVRETIKRFQFTDAELHGGSNRKTKAEAVYKSPYDDQTWSGRGRKPDWFKQALDEGYSDADMRIQG